MFGWNDDTRKGQGPVLPQRPQRQDPRRNPRHDQDDPTGLRTALTRLGLMLALAVLFASMAPPGLALASASSLLWLAGLATAMIGAFAGERVEAPVFTRWDVAAALLLFSMLAGAFVDPALVEQAIN